MPLIIDMLTQHFSRAPRKGIHPDECVAMGAALLADSMTTIDAVTLLDTLSVPVAIARDGQLQVVIDRNITLPARSSVEVATTDDHQTVLAIDVYQGERGPIDHGEYLGTLSYTPLAPAPAGATRLRLDFAVDAEGMLTVVAENMRTQERQSLTLKTVERAAPTPPPHTVAGIIEHTTAGPPMTYDAAAADAEHGIKGFIKGWLGKR